MLFHRVARALGSHPRLGAGGPGYFLTYFLTFRAAMTPLMMPAEPASPMGVAPRKIVAGLVSTAMMTSESPFTLRAVSAIVTSASTRAALTPSTVIDDFFVGPRVGVAFA